MSAQHHDISRPLAASSGGQATPQSTRPVGAIVAGWLLAGGDLTPALAAIALLVAVRGAAGLWLPALGRGPIAEP